MTGQELLFGKMVDIYEITANDRSVYVRFPRGFTVTNDILEGVITLSYLYEDKTFSELHRIEDENDYYSSVIAFENYKQLRSLFDTDKDVNRFLIELTGEDNSYHEPTETDKLFYELGVNVAI